MAVGDLVAEAVLQRLPNTQALHGRQVVEEFIDIGSIGIERQTPVLAHVKPWGSHAQRIAVHIHVIDHHVANDLGGIFGHHTGIRCGLWGAVEYAFVQAHCGAIGKHQAVYALCTSALVHGAQPISKGNAIWRCLAIHLHGNHQICTLEAVDQITLTNASAPRDLVVALCVSHHILAVTPLEDIAVVAQTACQSIVAFAAGQPVRAIIACQRVVQAVAGSINVSRTGQGEVLQMVAQGVAESRHHGVQPRVGAFVDRVQRIHPIGIVPTTARQHVGTQAAVQGVGRHIAHDHVTLVVARAVDGVDASEHQVFSIGSQGQRDAAAHCVGALAFGFHHHIANVVHQIGVVAFAAGEDVGTAASIQHIVACQAKELVVVVIAHQQVVGCVSGPTLHDASQPQVLQMVSQCHLHGGVDRVSTTTCGFDDHIAHRIHLVGVVTGTTRHLVIAGTTGQQVVASAALQHVVAVHAPEFVIAVLAKEDVPACFTKQQVVARVAADHVVASTTSDEVIAVGPKGHIVTALQHDQVVAIATKDHVVAIAGVNRVIAGAGIHKVNACAGGNQIIASARFHKVVAAVVGDAVVAGAGGVAVAAQGAQSNVVALRAHKLGAHRGTGQLHNAGGGRAIRVGLGDARFVAVAQRDVGHGQRAAVAEGGRAGAMHRLAIDYAERIVSGQVDARDAQPVQAHKLARIRLAIFVGILPHTKAGPGFVARLQHAVVVGVKGLGQGRHVGRGCGRVGHKADFVKAVDLAVGIAVVSQQTIAWLHP